MRRVEARERRSMAIRFWGFVTGRKGKHRATSGVERGKTEDEIQRWLVLRVADELDLDPKEIDVTVPVERYGLDSRAAASLSGDLEDWLGRSVPATLVWDYPTIEQISEQLKRS